MSDIDVFIDELPDLSHFRILAIDDNDTSNLYIRNLLTGTGIETDTASSGADAEKLLEKNRYDIVLLDHFMPEADGISLLKKFRSHDLCRDIPVIAVTANDVAGAKDNYLRAGFSDYIPKPVERTRLIDVIKKQLLHETDDAVRNSGESSEATDTQHILIVDDDSMTLRIAHRILADQYIVTCVDSAAQALKFLSQAIPDLILLDLHMPEMNGFELLAHLKALEQYKEIPIICLTADNDRDSEVKCFDLGALDFITKPFIAEIMRQRIGKILELSHLQKELQQEVEKQTRQSAIRRKRLERLTNQAMKTLAGTIDAKDKYTNGHSIRVAEYSREIARRLNMSDKEQDDIYYMGLLHDIGKIGVPDEIINKTSRLTDEEYGIIKTHPSIGADILRNMSEMPGIATGARWHHERYDGRGYPDGLKGEDIPVVARIIGVADAYDAMTSNRSYRDVLPQSVVRDEIEKGMGTQFDPVLAEVMLQIIDEDVNYTFREV